jgi:predicted alpha/beta hydrolase
MLQEELIKLKTKDKKEIALWKVSSTGQQANKHIFLTHGAFSNKKICLGIAHYFVEAGYCCWIMEWRNHGSSARIKDKFSLETIALYDLEASFSYLFKQEKIQFLSCITHSGGGILLAMFLIQYPNYIPKVKAAVIFACQAFAAAHNFKNTMRIQVGKWACFLLGGLAAKRIGHPHNESHFTMKQWFDWNLSKKFIGVDDFDYQREMPSINFPILSICGEGDAFIAPIQGCQAFVDAFQNPKNKLLYCGTSNGYTEDFGHGRILHSSSSREEIWPQALEWIESKQ